MVKLGKLMIKTTCAMFAVMSFVACSNDDEPDYGVAWDSDAMTYVHKGIDTSYNECEVGMIFTADSDAEISVSSDADWVRTEIMTYDDWKQLWIAVDTNRDATPRKAVVQLLADGHRTNIEVRQQEAPRAIADKEMYSLPAEGGEFTVRVKANGNLTAELFPIEGDWARITKITHDEKTGEYLVTLSVDKNEGLGRITAFWFKVNDEMPLQDLGPSIVQASAPFSEFVSVSAGDAGMLSVLLGNDVDNLHRIRTLTVSARLNGRDLQVLSQLFLSTPESAEKYPVNLDISNCDIVTGDKNPFEYYGWQPSTMEFPEITFYGELPKGVFTNAANLVSIALPGSMHEIDGYAFAGCSALKNIVVPDAVWGIGSNAFYRCSGLEDIILSQNSGLGTLGSQAFATGSTLHDLYIPDALVNIAADAFLGCSVSRLHLGWLVPPAMNIVPKYDGCTLFVPEGTLELYKNTRNWCNFGNIVEE